MSPPDAKTVSEPTFFVVSAFDQSVDDWMVLGIYSKREEADAHAASLSTPRFNVTAYPANLAGVARDLISNHLAMIAPGNRRVTITIEPSEIERGGSRVKVEAL